MANFELHPVQASALNTLRHAPQASFSELMKPTGLLSDAFKFHLRKLQHDGYVVKRPDGQYELTISGKEYTNNLDQDMRRPLKQPKISILVVAGRPGPKAGQHEFLVQQRRRKPFYNFWGFINGPARWGEDFAVTAANELRKQTGLTARLEMSGCYRKTDFHMPDAILEDKIFMVFRAYDIQGDLQTSWQGGRNQWLTRVQLAAKTHRFDDALIHMEHIDNGQPLANFFVHQAFYNLDEY